VGCESLIWGAGLVVDAFAFASGIGGPVDGFLGCGEEIQLQFHHFPQCSQDGAFVLSIVTVMEAVAAYDVVVFGFHGGLVVFVIRPGSGEKDQPVSGSVRDLMIDEF